MDDKQDLIMMLYAMTPTHAGSGTELSFVDLAIQREQHTGFPKIEASTLKGCIRTAVEADQKSKEKDKTEIINQIFGKFGNGDFAAAVSVTDARLLFFPVKSVIGIFTWITCPFVLRRFMEDYSIITGKEAPLMEDLVTIENCFRNSDNSGIAFCPVGNNSFKQQNTQNGFIMLEDYTYRIEGNDKLGKIIDKISRQLPMGTVSPDQFAGRTVLLNDDDFTHFVKYATEVSTRIQIDEEKGTVKGNALFTEEFLPPESILYSLVFFHDGHLAQKGEYGAVTKEKAMNASAVKNEFLRLFERDIFQIGADATLGKGLVKKRFWEVMSDEKSGS